MWPFKNFLVFNIKMVTDLVILQNTSFYPKMMGVLQGERIESVIHSNQC